MSYSVPRMLRHFVERHLQGSAADLPEYLEPALRFQERGWDAATPPADMDFSRARQLLEAHRALQDKGDRWTDRRAAEAALADYIEQQVLKRPDALSDRYLRELPANLRSCRRHGIYGVMPDGRPVVTWSAKCDCLQLCPDEAREEQHRLIDRYVPALEAARAKGFKIYKAVLTEKNSRPGELKRGMRRIFKKLQALRRARRDGKLVFPELNRKNGGGMLVTLEAPLGAGGDWNIHLNVILVAHPSSRDLYRRLREWWHCQVDIQDEISMRQKTLEKLRRRGRATAELTPDMILRHALKEIVKYPVQTVPEKSGDGAGEWVNGQFLDPSGERRAPAMTQWPPELWLEWWYAHYKFRRTRSYGCLYDTPKPEKPKLDAAEWIGAIEVSTTTVTVTRPWLGSIPLGDKFATEHSIPKRTTGPPGRKRPPTDAEVLVFWSDWRRARDEFESQQH